MAHSYLTCRGPKSMAVAALSGCAHNRCNSCCENGPCEKDTHFCVHPIRALLGIGQGTCRTCPETAASCPTCPQGICQACGGHGCGLCLESCPVGAISGEKKAVHVIDKSACIKCGACLEACPDKFKAVVKGAAECI